MHLLFCLCVVFLPAINGKSAQNLKKFRDDPVKETEAIFASVIQNITRVNNVLQELIQNYEQLQKIYKSQENIETVKSDDKIDKVYKSKVKTIKRIGPSEPAVTPESLATGILWDDSDEDTDGSKTSEESEDKESNANETPPSKAKKTEIVFIDNHKTAKTEDNEDIKSELTTKTEAPQVSVPTKIRHNMVTKDQTETNKQHLSNVKNERKVKTGKNIFRMSENRNNHSNYTPQRPVSRISNVEKKVYTETFSAKKIWDEIINNKPIKLEEHNDISLEALRKNNKENGSKGEALVIIAKNKAKGISSKGNRSELETENISSVKDELRATVLRQAYGDACLKLVVRKCYKALKAVSKSICSRYKCKSNYKEKYLDYSKKGCISEFIGNKTKGDEKGAGDKGNGGDDSDEDGKLFSQENAEKDMKFVDATREGYMQACLPHIETEIKAMQQNKNPARLSSNETSISSPKPSDFNILRDRFEKACKKISTTKCVNACTWTSDKICETFPCSSKKKKYYKSSCKKQCKYVYENYLSGYGSSDSDSSDSDDSDTDSDSSTETDTS